MLQVIEVDTGFSTEWLLTTNFESARRHLSLMGWTEIAIHDPEIIVAHQYQEVACLTTC